MEVGFYNSCKSVFSYVPSNEKLPAQQVIQQQHVRINTTSLTNEKDNAAENSLLSLAFPVIPGVKSSVNPDLQLSKKASAPSAKISNRFSCLTKQAACLFFFFLLCGIALQAQPAFTFNGVTNASPASYTGASNISISNKAFNNASGNDLTFTSCSNITISNCYFGSAPSSNGIYLNNCTNVTIINCFFANVGNGINAVGSNGPISITNNQFLNINGQGLFLAHAILLNNCNGAGILIDKNYLDSYYGENYVNDNINLYQSNGTAASPITVSNNIIRGGNSTSGTAIIAGDGGNSSYQKIINNLCVNTGSVGISAAGGQNITMNNNQIFSGKASYSNVGMYIWNQYSSACTNITATGNKINWTKSDGSLMNYWDGANCSNTNFDASNTYGQSLASMKVPAYLFTIPIDTFWYIRKTGFGWMTFLGLLHPSANAGSTQNITQSSTTLDGSKSANLLNGLNYFWAQARGPNTATISNPNAAKPTISGLVNGTYHFRLVVGDNGNGSGKDTLYDVSWVDVNVSGAGAATPNIPPVVSAGTSQTINLPTNTTTLSGTATDATGTITNYAWSQTSGPGTATIATPSALSTNVTGLVAGTYVFNLTVTDSYGLTASSTVTVLVNAAVNLAPYANAGANLSITLPTNSVTLNGSSSNDPDGSIAGYNWSLVSGPAQGSIASAGSATASANNLVQGTYVYQLTVTDNSGATGSDTVTVTVNAAVNQAPVANAGSSKTITLPVNTASLDGTQSADPDGTIAAYSWSQVSGPSTATISNNTKATAAVSGLVAGQYAFLLTVTDNSGATATAQVKVIVNAAVVNQIPVANAGSAQTITLPVNTTTLNGTASQDPDGTIAAYKWSQVSGPSQAAIVSSTSATSAVNSLVQGSYSFQLTVTDNSGATNADTVTVTVNAAANQLPVANAGSSKTVTLPVSSVSLDGTSSYATGATITGYAWSQLSGPSTATLANANTATLTAGSLQAGTYYFQLTITDSNGATASATVKVTVRAAANLPPIANAGANQSITLPVNSTTLNGNASQDPDGTISSYNWTKISGPAQGSIANSANAATSVSNLVQGTYVYQLTIKDNNGATGTDNITITVNAAINQPPVANAGSSKTITLPLNSVTLDGTKSSDADGTVTGYNWTEVSGPSTATVSSGNTAAPTMSKLVAGQYVFKLTVTDNSGATASAQVKIVVDAPPNQPPVANAGADQTLTLPVNNTTLDGSKSTDPDGTIASYSWNKISGSGAITLTNSNTSKPSVVGLQAGIYIFQLTVKDNTGASSTDNVTITVKAASSGTTNQSPVANAGTDQSITLPTNAVTLDGSKSSDPDGSISTYSWTKVSGTGGTITSANTAKPTVSGLQSGSYSFKLTVTDNKGATASDQVTVTVNLAAAAVAAPVANAGNDTTIAIPATTAVLDGSASGGSISSYEWTQVSGPNTATMDAWNEARTTVSGLLVGEYNFQLIVKNNNGVTSSSIVKVTVINNLRSTESFLLYPNPAQSSINLRIVNDSTGNMKINIYDMSGKLVLTSAMSKAQSFLDQSLNISALAHGMYTMQVIIGTRTKMISKFVKQ